MTLTIGSTDITPYIAYKGIKWQRADVDSAQATRTLDGSLQRARVATKIRLDITCRPLTATEAATILALIQPEWVTVTYSDPMSGTRSNVVMYSNNNPASYLMQKTNGNTTTEYWDGITFPLIEK